MCFDTNRGGGGSVLQFNLVQIPQVKGSVPLQMPATSLKYSSSYQHFCQTGYKFPGSHNHSRPHHLGSIIRELHK